MDDDLEPMDWDAYERQRAAQVACDAVGAYHPKTLAEALDRNVWGVYANQLEDLITAPDDTDPQGIFRRRLFAGLALLGARGVPVLTIANWAKA